jgi:hypothetical protein
MRAALLLIAVLTLAACTDPSSTPSRVAPARTSRDTRLVGARHVALAVPLDWKTHVEQGDYCPPTAPKTVEFFAPNHGGGIGSCSVPIGAAWPAQKSVSIYTKSSGGVRTPHGAPSGTVHGMPYYISDDRQSGPGMALTLTVPRAGVAFLVGAATRAAANALLATVQYVPAGTRLR